MVPAEALLGSTVRIQIGMDVFDAYQQTYIGAVIGTLNKNGGDAPPHLQNTAAEEPSSATSKTLGEELGPVPSANAGNTGPLNQSALYAYATHLQVPQREVAFLEVRPRRLNLGFLTPPLYIPVTAIRSVSMERIVVEVPAGRIPDRWRVRPAL